MLCNFLHSESCPRSPKCNAQHQNFAWGKFDLWVVDERPTKCEAPPSKGPRCRKHIFLVNVIALNQPLSMSFIYSNSWSPVVQNSRKNAWWYFFVLFIFEWRLQNWPWNCQLVFSFSQLFNKNSFLFKMFWVQQCLKKCLTLFKEFFPTVYSLFLVT